MAIDKTQERNRQYPGRPVTKLIKHGGVHTVGQDKPTPDLPIEIFPPPLFYIAGPFFNDPQRKMIERIEVAMCDHGVPFISPRQTDQNKKAALDDADAKEIFGQNILGMAQCGAMLAVLDWVMPPNKSLRPCDLSPWPTSTMNGPVDRWEANQDIALNLPDVGTVFEMGYVFGDRPIYGFTLRKPGDKVNLMLTQSLEGVIYGFEELDKFLNRGRIRPAHAVKGSWKHR